MAMPPALSTSEAAAGDPRDDGFCRLAPQPSCAERTSTRRTGGRPMPHDVQPDPVEDLVLDLLEWLGTSARPYAEVLDAWRTSCPRLPVWEVANDRGLVERRRSAQSPTTIAVSAAGQRYLARHRPADRALARDPSA
jgi:hypothetical protein